MKLIHKRIYIGLFALSLSASFTASAVDLEAAVGGGLGGAAGAVIGSEVGGREGAIVGGAIGAAVGTAIATEGRSPRVERETIYVEEPRPRVIYIEDPSHPKGRHCPPGQAKKGRC